MMPSRTLPRGDAGLEESIVAVHAAQPLPPLPRLGLEGRPGDEFELGETLGQGGMGVVVAATQRSVEREVAIKRPYAGFGPEAVAGLVREARMMGALEHPNIVPVHGLGLDERGDPVLVMRRIEGISWAALLADPEHAAWADLLARHGDRLAVHVEVLQRVCDALEMAHARGIVHRDVKPGNVMVGAFGEVYLVDWGVATRPSALTAEERIPGRIAGTPAYMAPEMVTGQADQVDARTDVYLVGATLHKVLTGRAPHAAGSMVEALQSAQVSQPMEYRPDVPAELAVLCRKAMSRDPAARPSSVREVRRGLADYLQNRHARALIQAAAQRLDRVGSSGDAALEKLDALRELTECRFGFLEALRAMPDDATARDGLRTSLSLLAKRELRLGNVDAAQAVLDQLDPPDPALLRELGTLRAEVAREAKLRAELRQEDPGPSAVSRWRLLLILLVGTIVALAALALRPWRERALPAWVEPIGFDLFVLLLFPIAALWTGRKLFVNRMARQFFAMGFCGVAGNLVSDLFNAAQGWDRLRAQINGHVIMATCLAIGAVSRGPLLWAAAAVQLAGAIAMTLAPSMEIPVISASMLLSIGILGTWVRRHLREQ